MNTPILRNSALLVEGALLPDGNLSAADRRRELGEYALVDWRTGVRKRESELLDPCPVIRPDGAIGLSDRESLVGLYAGIAATAAGSDRMIMLLDQPVLLPDGTVSSNDRAWMIGQVRPFLDESVYAAPQHSLSVAKRIGL